MAAIVSALRAFGQRSRPVERVSYIVGALLLASGLIHLAILAIGGGSWQGPLSLRKAMSFGLSFGLTVITIVWVASFLPLGERARAGLLGVFTLASTVETTLVTLQAWRGVPSHFNVSTSFDARVGRSLAIGGVVLIAIIVTLTVTAFRRRQRAPESILIAIRVGLLLLCGSLGVGGLMIAKGMRLVSAGHPATAYATGGAFKPTHAVMMHAILVLPLLAWITTFTDWPERRRARVVWLGSAGYVLLASIVSLENLRGVSMVDSPLWAVALALLGSLALVAAGARALAGRHARAERS